MEATRDTMSQTFFEVLERLAFMFGDPCPVEGLETDSEQFLHATIAFEGPVCGTIGVAAPVGLCAEIASNILGTDLDQDPFATGEAPDAFKEILNVICGQFLTTRYGCQPVFHLSIPRVEKVGRADWEALLERPETIGFLVEDAPAVVHLRVETSDDK